MKSKIFARTAITVVAVLTLTLEIAAQDQPEPGKLHYRIINLGTLGGTSSGGNGLNNVGVVTGASNLAGDQTSRATVWAYGLKRSLGTLGGPNSAVLFPVKNNFGEVAGVAETAEMQPLGEKWSCAFFFPSQSGHVCRGFSWQWNKITELPTLGGDNGFAAGINDEGQVVGWAENTTHDPTCTGVQVLQFEAVIWRMDNKPTQLSPFSKDADSAAVAINDRGQVVGISGDCDQAFGRFSARHAVLWENGRVHNLGSFGGKAWNTAAAINNQGQVAGFSDFPGDDDGTLNSHAFFWTSEGGMQDLGTLSEDTISLALGMNDRGQVVGESIGSNGARAFLWENGKMIDLNSTLPKGSTITLQFAGDINNRGEITGGMIDSKDPVKCAGGCAFFAIPKHEGMDSETISAVWPKNNPPGVAVPQNEARRQPRTGPFGTQLP